MVRYATLPLLYGESSWAELSYMHVYFFFSMLFSARMLPISMSLSSASIAIVIFFSSFTYFIGYYNVHFRFIWYELTFCVPLL